MSATESYKKFASLYKFVDDSKKLAFIKEYLDQIESEDEKDELSQLIDLSIAGLPAPPKKILLLIHGIRTQGKWMDLLESEIKKEGEFIVRHCKYPFFDALRFWLPIPWLFRSAPIKNVLRTFNTIIGKYPGADLCVIAHSNGTYILSKILEKNPQINVNKIVLCGSIVHEDHPWNGVKQHDRSLFINECGTSDIWPILAKTTTFGYGASGRFGSNHTETTNRYHDCGHGGFFTKKFITKFWTPFFIEGKVIESKWNRNRPEEKWLIQILGSCSGALLVTLTLITTSILCFIKFT